MVKVNWRDVKPGIAHEVGLDWQLLAGQSLKKDNVSTACMDSMMYVARALLQPTQSYHPHSHDDHEEIYYIISGKGEIRIDDEVQPIKDGDAIFIGVNQVHEIRNTGDEMIEFLAFAAQLK